MSKLSEKIKKIPFSKRVKQLIIATIFVAVIGGGLSAYLLRRQIGEWNAYTHNAYAQGQTEQEWRVGGEYGWPDDGYGHAGHGGWMGIGHGNWLGGWHGSWISEGNPAARITIAVVRLLGGAIVIAFWVLLTAWLYQAAERSGMNGLLWAAAGIVFHVFAAVAFLLVRSMIRDKCPSCGSYQSVGTQYCAKCGAAICGKCPACGASCESGDTFCRSCGKPLHEKED